MKKLIEFTCPVKGTETFVDQNATKFIKHAGHFVERKVEACPVCRNSHIIEIPDKLPKRKTKTGSMDQFIEHLKNSGMYKVWKKSLKKPKQKLLLD